jgi:hypothetical protein
MGAKPKTDRAAAKPSNDALRAVFAGAVTKPAAANKGDKGLKGGSQASTSGTSAGSSRNDSCRPWLRCAGATSGPPPEMPPSPPSGFPGQLDGMSGGEQRRGRAQPPARRSASRSRAETGRRRLPQER